MLCYNANECYVGKCVKEISVKKEYQDE
jgi:hypothetical protein